jgi:hydrophobic/amphiphilic exporter-1 (mainly G- bacteria), HAE1 family
MFVAGVMGKFFAVMPLAVIAMLVISLIEAMFILPCHLSRTKTAGSFAAFARCCFPFRPLATCPLASMIWSNRFLDQVITQLSTPVRWAVHHRSPFMAMAVALLLGRGRLHARRSDPVRAFPKLDTRTIEARVTFPDGTPGQVTDRMTRQAGSSLPGSSTRNWASTWSSVATGWPAGPPAPTTHPRWAAPSGGHLGLVSVELVAPEGSRTCQRTSDRTLAAGVARALRQGIPRHRELEVRERRDGTGRHADRVQTAIPLGSRDFEQFGGGGRSSARPSWRRTRGVIDIDDDSRPGKWEYQIRREGRSQSRWASPRPTWPRRCGRRTTAKKSCDCSAAATR